MDKGDQIERNLIKWGRDTLRAIGKRMRAIGGMSKDDARMLPINAEVDEVLSEVQRRLAIVTARNVRLTGDYSRETLAAVYSKMEDLYKFRGIKSRVNGAALANEFSLSAAREMVNLSQTRVMSIYDPDSRRVLSLRNAMTEAFDKAASSVVNGDDFISATRRTVKMLGGSGVRVSYDGITRRLDTVVRQNVLYQQKQAAQAYSYQLGAEIGCDGIEIDWHADSRPSHEFMQGKQYAIHGAVEAYGEHFPGADEAGVYEALEDYGCRHFATPIILGISEPAYSEEELERLKEEQAEKKVIDSIDDKPRSGYEWSQYMRRLEAETRRQKDIEAGAEGTGDVELARQCRKRVLSIRDKYMQIRDKYVQISEAANIKQDLSRMVIVE